MTPNAASKGPGVKFPPPLLFVAGLAVSLVLDHWFSVAIDGDEAGITQTALGIVLVAGGLSLMAWGIATFVIARTDVYPNRPARQLVCAGPYRFTRNPMYVGLTAAYAGGALLLNTVWPFLVLPLVLVLLQRLVIGREEAYLRLEFGNEYEAYCGRVRRWI